MRVLVTGGAGYIGSVIAERLLDDGHAVWVLDDLRFGHESAIDSRATFVRCALQEEGRITETLRTERVDTVIHMAGDSRVGESVSDPAKYYENNVGGSLALLAAMRAAKVDRLVFSSSAAVYGAPATQPIPENAEKKPTNPYGETKLTVERILSSFADAYGLKSVALRYFNAAGASTAHGECHSPETHLIPIVIDVARGRRELLTIHGDDFATPDGTCVRDYVHVSDLADAHLAALHAVHSAKTPSFDAYNVGTGKGNSVLEVVAAVERVSGVKIRREVGPRRVGDPAELVADPTRIIAELGFRARRTSIDEIVESAWRFANESQSANGPVAAQRSL